MAGDVTRDIANLLNRYPASYRGSRELVGGLEPRGELSIDVRRLLEAYLEVPTVGGRLLRFSMRGLRMSVADFSVRMSEERRVATPANAVWRTRCIEVFLASSVTGSERACDIDEPLVSRSDRRILPGKMRCDAHSSVF